ncbi:glycoside hydrolase family 3 N-terminal domain-containing protein [Nocardioides sp. GCM10027113]|uniref:glycoside hydrolase family 3 N-terminal domain-containing protein n=1 Tax=unclassified Nocardioides TaxID=2615069 RepID=UPI00360D6D3D
MITKASLAAAATLALLVTTGCSTSGPVAGPTSSDRPSPSSSAGAETATTDPDTPLGWGPTTGELAQAQELVAGWSAEQLAGQVIVGRFHGTDPALAARLVRRHHLAGMSVTTENVVDEAQVRELTRAIDRAARAGGRDFPAVVGVDQEGGVVAHLRGVATDFPSFATAGAAVARAPREGRSAVEAAAEATAWELRDLGFSWVFAPVADVTIGAADPTIGSRSPSNDPRTAAATVAAAVSGYSDGAVVSTTKHFPGHGRATADSHETLPVVPAPRRQLEREDLVPFRRAVEAGAPAVMVAHLDVTALAPGVPSSLAPEVYDLLRDDLGFEGVAVTDSLGMGGVVGRSEPAVTALAAGADLLLMPPDPARTHATVTDAIESGRVTRERAEEAAARVVALQLWQQRTSAETEVPADVASRAAAAAQRLMAAAYG